MESMHDMIDQRVSFTGATIQQQEAVAEESKKECKKISDREKDALLARKLVTNYAIKEFLDDYELGLLFIFSNSHIY